MLTAEITFWRNTIFLTDCSYECTNIHTLKGPNVRFKVWNKN